ncbi:MAG: hypothetical protein GY774_16610 [Planctomycetes bacterium]|nr:hypothetical protein [Planctomycetota bacterium]
MIHRKAAKYAKEEKMITVYEKRLIKELVNELELPNSIEDAEILKKSAGTLTRARIELQLALSDLRLAISQHKPRLRKLFKL